MAQHFYNNSYSWSENYSPLFDIPSGDSVTFGPSASLISSGINSPAVKMTGEATIQMQAGAQIVATHEAFHASGGNNTFEMEAQTYLHGGSRAMIAYGTNNTFNISQGAEISAGSDDNVYSAAIYSDGSSTINTSGIIGGYGPYTTAIFLSGGNNQIESAGAGTIFDGCIFSKYIAIDILESNNTIDNSGLIIGEAGPAIRIDGSRGGTNTINNMKIILNPTGGGIGDAILIYGQFADSSSDRINNDGLYPQAPAEIFGRISLNGGDDSVVNGRAGVIHDLIDLGDGRDILENDGITAGVISLGAGPDSLMNRAKMLGAGISLGSGDDRISNSGNITSYIHLDDGDDRYYSFIDGSSPTGTVTGEIHGGSGSDEIYGGNSNDIINGGSDSDFLHGGAGSDIFRFNTELDRNIDRVDDFKPGEDQVQLYRYIFEGLQPGYLPEDAFCRGSSPQDASDRIGYDPFTGHVWYDQDGTGETQTIVFAVLKSNFGIVPYLRLNASDFLIV